MAGTIIVSSIKTDTDNSFIVRSNTGATLFSVDTTSISIPDGSITSAMIANGTVIAADILDGTITDAKITAVANTKITGLITAGQIATVANTQITGLITAGQIASVANTQITGNITQAQIATGVAGTGPAFSAYKFNSQTINAAALTKIQIDTELFDTNSNYDNATNYRFTPTVAGYYQVNAAVNFGTARTLVITSIYKNGSRGLGGETVFAGAISAATSIPVSNIVYMNGSSDYLELYGYSDTGTNAITTGINSTYFSAAMVRSA